MPLPVPNLDDRKFQDILDEARRLIPRYCPEWTDHNLSDPGITLLELFAWMTDLMLYRLNRVPERNYLKFLELIGVQLQPARPATADLLFRLTAPQPEAVVIPAGTAAGTVRTDTQESVTFATQRDLLIDVPRLAHVVACRAGASFHDYQPALDDPRQGLGVFADVPQEHDALYLGFANSLSAHTLAITLQCRIEGIGVDPTDPPLAWETWDGLDHRWVALPVAQDTTGGLNRNGIVIVDTPPTAAPVAVDGTLAFWLRCRVLPPRPGQPAYSDTPRVTGVTVQSIGGQVSASHAFLVTGEVLGESDGTPGQTFRLQTLPVLPRQPGETLELDHGDGTYQPWQEVLDFGRSTEHDPHFLLDAVSGVVRLGPCIRSPEGRERQYGAIPLAGRELRFTRYRSGGGVVGNVGARTLTVLKSSIPYVDWVANPAPASGGTDSEDVEQAKLRGPQLLRQDERAVTPQDFVSLTLRASPAVARARCQVAALAPSRNGPVHTAGGAVRLLLVPALNDADGPLTTARLSLSPRVKQDVQAFLDERRLLTCEVELDEPPYTWVGVVARLRARPGADPERVAARSTAALYRYLHPTAGGPDGQGWPFGRELFATEVATLLARVEGVDLVEDAYLYPVDPTTQDFGQATTRVTPGPDGLVCSAEHRIEVSPS